MSARLTQLFHLDTERRRLRAKRLKGTAAAPDAVREDDITDRLLTGLIEALTDVSRQALAASSAARRPHY